MPIIECRDCGHQISDAAAACVHCGCPNETGRRGLSSEGAGNPVPSQRSPCPSHAPRSKGGPSRPAVWGVLGAVAAAVGAALLVAVVREPDRTAELLAVRGTWWCRGAPFEFVGDTESRHWEEQHGKVTADDSNELAYDQSRRPYEILIAAPVDNVAPGYFKRQGGRGSGREHPICVRSVGEELHVGELSAEGACSTNTSYPTKVRRDSDRYLEVTTKYWVSPGATTTTICTAGGAVPPTDLPEPTSSH